MCNAERSCSTAFSTGYASRHSSGYKSQEQLFRVHLGSIVQQGLSAQYTNRVKFFPPSLPLETIKVWALFCAMPSNKLETLLGGAIKSVQPLPPCLLAALLFNNIACKPVLLSDPAHAVLHSARSAREISEVLWSRHRWKSHRLT